MSLTSRTAFPIRKRPLSKSANSTSLRSVLCAGSPQDEICAQLDVYGTALREYSQPACASSGLLVTCMVGPVIPQCSSRTGLHLCNTPSRPKRRNYGFYAFLHSDVKLTRVQLDRRLAAENANLDLDTPFGVDLFNDCIESRKRTII